MSLLIVVQIALDLAFITLVTILYIDRVRVRSGDDPRLTRGLQILTSKIAVLQDLLDRSETTGRQLGQIIDRKNQDVQERVEEIESHLHKVYSAIEKSQQVAQIFQDKIPHQEIIERQKIKKYISAAKLAHQGTSESEISRQVDIPRGELDLIMKLNKQKLVFDKEPGWLDSAKPLTAQFPVQSQSETPASDNMISDSVALAKAAEAIKDLQFETEKDDGIKPVIFRKISMTDNLS